MTSLRGCDASIDFGFLTQIEVFTARKAVKRTAAVSEPVEIQQEVSEPAVRELAQVFKLLSDETRLRILFYLAQNGELHVTDLCNRLGQSQPACQPSPSAAPRLRADRSATRRQAQLLQRADRALQRTLSSACSRPRARCRARFASTTSPSLTPASERQVQHERGQGKLDHGHALTPRATSLRRTARLKAKTHPLPFTKDVLERFGRSSRATGCRIPAPRFFSRAEAPTSDPPPFQGIFFQSPLEMA